MQLCAGWTGDQLKFVFGLVLAVLQPLLDVHPRRRAGEDDMDHCEEADRRYEYNAKTTAEMLKRITAIPAASRTSNLVLLIIAPPKHEAITGRLHQPYVHFETVDLL
jgi:hypothetical protein